MTVSSLILYFLQHLWIFQKFYWNLNLGFKDLQQMKVTKIIRFMLYIHSFPWICFRFRSPLFPFSSLVHLENIYQHLHLPKDEKICSFCFLAAKDSFGMIAQLLSTKKVSFSLLRLGFRATVDIFFFFIWLSSQTIDFSLISRHFFIR